jgi:hypothetical protein
MSSTPAPLRERAEQAAKDALHPLLPFAEMRRGDFVSGYLCAAEPIQDEAIGTVAETLASLEESERQAYREQIVNLTAQYRRRRNGLMGVAR